MKKFGIIVTVCAVISTFAALSSMVCALGFIKGGSSKPKPAAVSAPTAAPTAAAQEPEDLTNGNTHYGARNPSGLVKFRPVLYAYKSGEHVGEFTTWKTVEIDTTPPSAQYGNKTQVAIYRLEKVVTVEPTLKEVTK